MLSYLSLVYRYLVWTVLMIFGSGLLAAEDTVRYVIRAGETWESICRDYGVDFSSLQSSNPWLEADCDCSVGLEIDIYPSDSDGDLLLNRLQFTDSRYLQAQKHYAAGEYKKAVKIYDKIIRNDVGSYAAMYMRGRAQLMCGKYGKAIDDFSSARAMTFSSLDVYCDEAVRLKEEQSERRSAIWGDFFGGLLGTAAITGTAIASQSYNDSYGNMGYIPAASGFGTMDMTGGCIITPGGNFLPPMPALPDPSQYDLTPVWSTDAYGNMMVSNPGMAQMEMDMAANTMELAQYSASVANNSTDRAIANANMMYANSNMAITSMDAMLNATPHYLTGPEDSGAGVQDSEPSTYSYTGSSDDFLADYQSAESRARNAYESLTLLGGSYTSSDGTLHGSTGSRGNAGGSAVQLKMMLRNAQKEMADIRLQAMRNGVTIPKSSLETATVTYSGSGN